MRNSAQQRRAGGLVLRLFFLAIASASVPAIARAESVAPEAVIRGFDSALVQVMRDGKLREFQSRYDELAPTIDTAFDFAGMTSVALGSAWPELAPQERTAIVTAFRQFSIATYVAAFDDYAGESFVITSRREIPQGVMVTAELIDANQHKVTFGYLLHAVDGSWRVIDIYLDGTISMLAIRRSEFSSVMARSGLQGVVTRLHEQADKLAHERKVAANP